MYIQTSIWSSSDILNIRETITNKMIIRFGCLLVPVKKHPDLWMIPELLISLPQETQKKNTRKQKP